MRSANHELLGVTEMSKFQDIGLCCPLMTVIDWRGYRLIAMSKLPISKEVYFFSFIYIYISQLFMGHLMVGELFIILTNR